MATIIQFVPVVVDPPVKERPRAETKVALVFLSQRSGGNSKYGYKISSHALMWCHRGLLGRPFLCGVLDDECGLWVSVGCTNSYTALRGKEEKTEFLRMDI